MSISFDDADRETFFETARRNAQREWEADNKNAQALVKWGGALLELAHYRQGEEATKLIEQAISKLKQAIEINDERPEAEWCLGNAYTSLGFLCPQKSKAQLHFKEAAQYFKRCLKKDPTNDMYKKALDMCDKAPEYYDEIHQQIQLAQGVDEAASKVAKPAEPAANEFWWDVAGWAVLGVAVVGMLTFMRTAGPAPTATS